MASITRQRQQAVYVAAQLVALLGQAKLPTHATTTESEVYLSHRTVVL